jgi:hypothetical protein
MRTFKNGDRVTVDGNRIATLLFLNHHTDLWAVRYPDEPGVYYHVSESRLT